MTNLTVAYLPLGILGAAIVLMGSGLIWARYRDHRLQQEKDHQQALVIVQRIKKWAGSEEFAWAWYRTYPIAPLGGYTACQLVDEGRADDVLTYLSHADRAGFS